MSGSTGGTSDGFEAFAPLEVPVPGFAVGGQRAVVGTNAGLYSVDLTGGAEPVLLAPGEVSIQDVAPHGTDYYAVLDDTVVRGVLASTAAPTPIVVPPDPIEGLAVGDDQFFFSTCALPILEPFAIYAQGHDESEPVRIATDPQVAVCPSLLTVGEGSVWLAEINSSSGVYGFNSISRYRVDGTGSPEVIARGELYPSALFVVDGSVFWATAGAQPYDGSVGALKRVDLVQPSTVHVYAEAPDWPRQIFVDTDWVYWSAAFYVPDAGYFRRVAR